MRRKDRELSAQDGLAIIDACEYGTISCVGEEGEIFSVPISVVREDESVFLHGAPAGSKARLLKDGKSVTLVCVSYAQVLASLVPVYFTEVTSSYTLTTTAQITSGSVAMQLTEGGEYTLKDLAGLRASATITR